MVNSLLLPELRDMLAAGDRNTLAEVLTELHPASIAEFSEGLDAKEIWELLECAPVDRQAEIFGFYSPHRQDELVGDVGRQQMGRLLEAMPHDDRVDLLKRLDDKVVESLLPLVANADRQDIRKLLTYPEGSAGSVMTTDYASLPADISVSEAIAQLRQQAPATETIYYVYILDDQRHLLGFVSLCDLIVAKSAALVRDVMQHQVISVDVQEDQEEVARKLAKYDFLAIPVVDEQHRLVGIVTHDDVADVLQAEVTEDFQLGSAVAPLVEGYGRSGVWALYQRRVGWLLILVLVNLFSSGVIAAYEETLQAVIALAFFLPLLIDSGGNAGSQIATLIVRALATNEVSLKHWYRIIGKEFLVGVSLGLTMAVASFVLGVFRGGFEVGLIVGTSMVCIILFTNLFGALLPFVLTRLRFDPAVASSPLITTVADAAGLLLYFSIATRVIGSLGGI